MNKIKLVIFDLDGTLLNTIVDLANSCNDVLRTLNFEEHTVDDYKMKVGKGVLHLITQTLPKKSRDSESIKKGLKLFKEIYKKRNGENNKPYPGIPALLKNLNSQKIKIAILSNKPQINTEDCMNDYFPDIKFDLVYGARKGVPLKPDPTAVLEIIKSLNVKKDETLFIGDSDIDIETALNAKIKPIAVDWGFRSREILKKYNIKIVSNSRELENEIL